MEKNRRKEIGGYIELDTYSQPMMHEEAIALNCGRNALAYLIRAKGIKRIMIPWLICDSVIETCNREKVSVTRYHVGKDFKPQSITVREDEWLYLVNYYGQFSNNEISEYKRRFDHVIVDQAQSYYQIPTPNTDTLYSCRKYFGVPDGAFLYSDAVLLENIPQDESFDRMSFLLGRFERPASEFYEEYRKNNAFFINEPIKKMSRLTENLLRGIDYCKVEKIRRNNYQYLHEQLKDINLLRITKEGTFMYPLMIDNGEMIRVKLQKKKIYIPILWPTVLDVLPGNSIEYRMAKDTLPLPIDQRYGVKEMNYIVSTIKEML